MAISKEKLREMRENSRLGAAKQRAKEQAALDKYMYRRNTEVAQMMSAKERNEAIKKAYTEEGKSVEQIMEAFELTSKRVCKILGISEKPSGIIDAAELSNEEREVLTAQAEADAGMYYDSDRDTASAIAYDMDEQEGICRGPYEYGPFTDEPEPRKASDKPQEEPDICDVAKKLMVALRKAVDVPDYVDVNLSIINGLYELEVKDSVENDTSATLTWRL